MPQPFLERYYTGYHTSDRRYVLIDFEGAEIHTGPGPHSLEFQNSRKRDIYLLADSLGVNLRVRMQFVSSNRAMTSTIVHQTCNPSDWSSIRFNDGGRQRSDCYYCSFPVRRNMWWPYHGGPQPCSGGASVLSWYVFLPDPFMSQLRIFWAREITVSPESTRQPTDIGSQLKSSLFNTKTIVGRQLRRSFVDWIQILSNDL